jgi:hypothetical protein
MKSPRCTVAVVVVVLGTALLHLALPCRSFSVDPLLHFGAGAVAGGIGALVAYPCDYVKSQLQTERGKSRYGGNGWDCLVDTVANQSVAQLYKGLSVQLVGIAPEKGIKLGVNDMISSYSYAQYGSFPLEVQILSGAVAGACQVVASSPLDVLKVGMQTSSSEKTLHDVWRSVGGYRGLFRGAEACAVRDVVFTAMCFPLYTVLLQHGVNPFVAGAVSGVVSSLAATPPDVVRTRILAQQHNDGNDPAVSPFRMDSSVVVASTAVAAVSSADPTKRSPPRSILFSNSTMGTDSVESYYAEQSSDIINRRQWQNTSPTTNPWTVFQSILQKEGPEGLFSGYKERCIGAIPRFGTTLAVHDMLEQYLHTMGWLSS